ncbi:vitamin B12 transporter [Spirosomataceae bacterium TFI 002]|nr:vitamin B12 transporter [Spirosomataceae bacterium TFI 002]
MFSSKKIALLFLLSTVTSFAQLALDETIVVASKYQQKQSQIGRIVTVLSDSLIQQNQHLSLTGLLNQQVGIQIVGSSQAPGSLQSVFTRGAGAGYTLILLDGVPVYDPSNIEGNFDLNFISLANIERIEVLKGGQSTLYGSNAVAGVINIISKKGVSKAFVPSIGFQAGSFNSLDFNVNTRGLVKKLAYDLSYQKSRSDGFSSAVGDGFENDGFDRNVFRSKLSTSFGVMNLRLKGDYSKYTADIDAGGFTDDKDNTFQTENFQVGGGFDIGLDKSKIVMNYLISKIDRTFEDDSTDVAVTAFNKYSLSTFGTLSNFLDLYGSFDLNKNLKLLAGGEFTTQNTDQSYRSVSDFGEFIDAPIEAKLAQMENYAMYTSLNYQSETGFGVEAGFRANHHSTYDWNSSYTLSTFYKISPSIKALAVWASSFKNPSLYQLFSPYGNTDLTPEKSNNLDLGLEWRSVDQQRFVQLAYFNRNIKNGIVFQGLDSAPYGIYMNQDEQKDQGVELDVVQKVGSFRMNGNYTFLNGYAFVKDANDQDKKYNLLRRPKNAFNVGIGYSVSPKLNLDANFQFTGSREDRFYNSTTFSTEEVNLASYGVLNVVANYDITKSFHVFANLRNITNAKYQEVYGFNSEPFNFKVGIRYGR